MKTAMVFLFCLLSGAVLAAKVASPAPALYVAVSTAAGCQITQVVVPDVNDKATWMAVYDPSCTSSQIAAGNAAITAFDLSVWKSNLPAMYK